MLRNKAQTHCHALQASITFPVIILSFLKGPKSGPFILSHTRFQSHKQLAHEGSAAEPRPFAEKAPGYAGIASSRGHVQQTVAASNAGRLRNLASQGQHT